MVPVDAVLFWGHGDPGCFIDGCLEKQICRYFFL
jgi:hypothetical protein